MIDEILSEYDLTRADVLDAVQHDENDIVYITGSIIEGFCNTRSDFDVFRIASPQVTDTHRVALLKNNKFEFVVLNKEKVERIISRANAIDPDDPKHYVRFLSRWDKKFLNRLLIGLPILQEDRFYQLRDRVDHNNLNRLIVRDYVNSYDNAFEDMCGALESGDLFTSYFNSHTMLNHAMDAYLAALGDNNVQAKWRIRKMEKHLGVDNPIFELFL